MMQSGLVRADNGHIVSACFAMVFLAGAILVLVSNRPTFPWLR